MTPRARDASTTPTTAPRDRVRAMLGDVHLWVPLVVLVGGLAVLAWVHG